MKMKAETKRILMGLIALALFFSLLSGCKSQLTDELASADEYYEEELREEAPKDEAPEKEEEQAPSKPEREEEPADQKEEEKPSKENSATDEPFGEEKENSASEKPSGEEEEDSAADEPSGEEKENSASEKPSVEEEEDSATDEPSVEEEEDSATDEPSGEEEEDSAADEPSDKEDENKKPAFSMDKALKVTSFNIKSCNIGKTMDQVVALLKKVDADLVGLQEVDCNSPRSGNIHQAQEIARRAGYPYFCYTPAHIIGDNDEINTGEINVIGHAILSKYPILRSEIIWPKALGDRPRNFSRHEIDVNGKTVAFYNCHLDFNEGRYQYEEIQDDYMTKDQYAICVGDFNETMDEMFLQFDYENFHSLAFGDEMESPYLNKKGNQVIDHIVVSKKTISWYDEEVQNGYYVVPHNGASDHNLVYGYFNLLD